MIDIKNILKGWGAFITSPNKLSEEQRANLKVCDECPDRDGSSCGDCGCYLPAKVRSDSTCPQNKWK